MFFLWLYLSCCSDAWLLIILIISRIYFVVCLFIKRSFFLGYLLVPFFAFCAFLTRQTHKKIAQIPPERSSKPKTNALWGKGCGWRIRGHPEMMSSELMYLPEMFHPLPKRESRWRRQGKAASTWIYFGHVACNSIESPPSPPLLRTPPASNDWSNESTLSHKKKRAIKSELAQTHHKSYRFPSTHIFSGILTVVYRFSISSKLRTDVLWGRGKRWSGGALISIV